MEIRYSKYEPMGGLKISFFNNIKKYINLNIREYIGQGSSNG